MYFLAAKVSDLKVPGQKVKRKNNKRKKKKQQQKFNFLFFSRFLELQECLIQFIDFKKRCGYFSDLFSLNNKELSTSNNRQKLSGCLPSLWRIW